MKKIKFFLIFNFLFMNELIDSKPIILMSFQKADNENLKITLSFHLNKDEYLYSNSINISADDPNIILSDWRTDNNFLSSSKELDKDFNINLEATKINNQNSNVNLHVNYMQNNNEIHEESFKLNFVDRENTSAFQAPQKTVTDKNQIRAKEKSDVSSKKSIGYYLYNLSTATQELIKKSNSIWLQLFLVFILGILMSLTPCIYPVIPITAGILQMQGSKSILYNLFLSLSYAFGIATTFALFGLTAAMGGHLFGQILMQPAFVIFISAFFVYLALSMFGFYDIYIPKFLSSSNSVQKNGSPLSAFMFGAVSGSIASPCLSPGLALLLTIVASLANKFLGFILLFSFGIGLSVPLILVGTFSSSINVLPRAGMWMEEVKKIFGFLLIGMSFYYLSNILPVTIILWTVSIAIFMAGVYYFNSIQSCDSKGVRLFKNCLGVFLVSSSIFVTTKAYQKTFYDSQETINENLWSKNYDEALKQAIKENKNLIIDIGAAYCTICKAIDQKVFNNEQLQGVFKKFVLVKVDATYPKQEPYASIKQRYYKEIMGAPTILIIDPNNGNLLKRWGSELYEMPLEDIKTDLQKMVI